MANDRLIGRFTDTGHLDIPSLEVMSSDFNNAESFVFFVKKLFQKDAQEQRYVDIRCSAEKPGIVLTVRDSDISVCIDEKEGVKHIVENLKKWHKSIWDNEYIHDVVKQLINEYNVKYFEKAPNLYCGMELNNGGVIRSCDTPIAIFKKARTTYRTVVIQEITGMKHFDNIIPPQIDLYLDDGWIATLSNIHENPKNASNDKNLLIDNADVKLKKECSDLIPQEIIQDRDKASLYLVSHKTVRKDNAFTDIDLF